MLLPVYHFSKLSSSNTSLKVVPVNDAQPLGQFLTLQAILNPQISIVSELIIVWMQLKWNVECLDEGEMV